MLTSTDVSFIVCTHNGSSRIERVLNSIVSGHASAKARCEVILVDNASSDNVADLAARHWTTLQTTIPLTIVNEGQPGLMYARLSGVRRAAGSILCFIDDDNYIDGNWADALSAAFLADPGLGMMGGVGRVPDGHPAWFPLAQRSFAVGLISASEQARKNFTLYGAGMAMRSDVFAALLGSGIAFQFAGHSLGKMGGADDSEICLYYKALGYRLTQNPNLTFVHDISLSRMTYPYVRKLGRRDGFYTSYLEYAFSIVHNGVPPKRSVALAALNLARAASRMVKALHRSVREGSLVPLMYHSEFFLGYVPFCLGVRDKDVLLALENNIDLLQQKRTVGRPVERSALAAE